MSPQANTRSEMNAMYRWTRHVYDASRKYYLLGRDILIAKLHPKDGEYVCEVGCGTARNLRKLAVRYPSARFMGIDASDEMLKTAKKILTKLNLAERVPVKQAYAENFDPAALFAISRPLDKIIFSYSLSIIPPWRESIDHALELLPLGGQIHIVDFGGQDDLPPWFRALLFAWLKLFHVYHRPEILEHLNALAAQGKGALEIENLYRGYAYRAVFIKA